MKTGNTEGHASGLRAPHASMEPGHEDREYRVGRRWVTVRTPGASMEPGHEDREYSSLVS